MVELSKADGEQARSLGGGPPGIKHTTVLLLERSLCYCSKLQSGRVSTL
jgi:hypothetical protein